MCSSILSSTCIESQALCWALDMQMCGLLPVNIVVATAIQTEALIEDVQSACLENPLD